MSNALSSTLVSIILLATCAGVVFSDDEEFPFPKHCGEDFFQDKIIFGDIARIDEFPWMALLKYQTEAGVGYGCGGTLINKRYVLTAAHCTIGKFGAPVEVTLGEYDVSKLIDCVIDAGTEVCADPPQFIPIEEIVKYPEYDSVKKLNDIALIRLKTPANITDFVRPICVPTSEIQKELLKQTGNQFNIAGWGETKHQESSTVKRKALVPVVDNAKCAKGRIYKIEASHICAGGGLQDTCRGDSGGPLMTTRTDDFQILHYLCGVVAYGSKVCGSGQPAVYTNVAYFRDWIVRNMRP